MTQTHNIVTVTDTVGTAGTVACRADGREVANAIRALFDADDDLVFYVDADGANVTLGALCDDLGDAWDRHDGASVYSIAQILAVRIDTNAYA